jgi:hypothetical protein
MMCRLLAVAGNSPPINTVCDGLLPLAIPLAPVPGALIPTRLALYSLLDWLSRLDQVTLMCS